VKHPCQRCGSAVADDLPFCPDCEAPQIRFSPPEASADSVVVGTGVGGFSPGYARVEPTSYPYPSTASSNWHGAVRPALKAGAIGAALSALPLGPAFILALPLAGFLCVLFYRRRGSGTEPSPGAGFGLGALSGAFGFAIFVVLTAVETIVFQAQNELRDAMIQAIRQAQARSADPQVRQMLDYFATPQGLLFLLIFGFVFMCIVFVVLSGLGGAVSAALLRRKGPPS
jgi:predicted  nucleic acid-binding Zn-ribbon protein